MVAAEYPWLPPICSHCKLVGLLIRHCPKVAQVWQPTGTEASLLSLKWFLRFWLVLSDVGIVTSQVTLTADAETPPGLGFSSLPDS